MITIPCKTIVKLFFIAVFLGSMILIDQKHYTYIWYRLINGDNLGPAGLNISQGFFIFSIKGNEFTISHIDALELPFLVKLDSGLKKIIDAKAVQTYKKFNGCVVYKSSMTRDNDFYVFFEAYPNVSILVLNELEDESYFEKMCGLIK